MTKTKPNIPQWVTNLRSLMEMHGYNPRSLSLKAGLNSTAVRDMLEGRSRYPRYDTAKALAEALQTTPEKLMENNFSGTSLPSSDDKHFQLDVLTEIITCLQETSDDLGHKLKARDFAAMTATVYSRVQSQDLKRDKFSSISPYIHDLLGYEKLRQKRARS